jgi:hypothetical protein
VISSISPQLETIVSKLLGNIGTVRYGDVSVLLKVHDGRVVSVTHTVTESTRQTPEGIVNLN